MKQELDHRQRFDIMYREGLDSNWFDETIPEEARGYLNEILTVNPALRKKPVMDIGCGRGQLLCYLEQEGFNRIVGVDVSEVAVNFAKQHTKRSEILVADVIAGLPFKDNTFSLVTELTVLSSLDPRRWPTILGEIRRVLVQGGFYISEIFSRDQSCNLNQPLITSSAISRDLDPVYGVTKNELFDIFGKQFSIKQCAPTNPKLRDNFFVLAQKL